MEMFIVDLQAILTNPYSLLFLALFGLGYFIKEKTKISNKLIPIILIASGIGLAFLLLGVSVTAGIIGFVLSSLIMANYETIRNTISYYFERKSE